MLYVDGYVLPILKKNIKAYQKVAAGAGKVWRKCGAMEYRECVGEDLNVKMCVPFPKKIKLKPGETIVFAWIVFKSRAHRDRVNAKVMEEMKKTPMDSKTMPFDVNRIVYGGFEVLVDV